MEGQNNEAMVGQLIGGRYRLTKMLGEGGMGAVFLADHVNITKTVAVKLLHPEISQNEEAVVRFKQEAQSASSIGHPNIVGIDDFFTMEDGRVCLIMEFLEGQALDSLMEQAGGLDPTRAMDIMLQVCDGLHAAHEKGIIHRDMKPENVFLASVHGKELVKILDFGIAKVTGNEDNNLTKTGTVFGTPHYMSPEQALGHKVDARADVYSVGVMLFEIFTGKVPYQAESFMGVLSQHITKPVPIPSAVSAGRPVPKMMEDIIVTAMAKEVDKRFSNMQALRNALVAFSETIKGAGGDVAKTGVAEPAVGAQVAAAAAASGGDVAGVAPTMMPGAVTGPPAAAAPAGAPPQTAIPKTMMATADQMPAATPMATPATAPPSLTGGAPAQKSKKGLIIGIAAAVLLLGGGAAAAVVFLGGDDGGTQVAQGDEPKGADENKGEPTGDEPKGDEPKGDEPKGDEPKGDEPKGDQPKGDQPKGDQPKGDQPKGDQPKGDQPKGDQPKGDQPKGDEPTPTKKDDPPPVKKDDPPPVKKDDPPPVKKDDPPPVKKDPPPKPKPTHCTVTLSSFPGGAKISGGGKTPKTFKLKIGKTKRVRLSLRRYKSKSVSLSCNGGDRDVSLEKKVKAKDMNKLF